MLGDFVMTRLNRATIYKINENSIREFYSGQIVWKQIIIIINNFRISMGCE
jgi:hypothetical protein